VILNLGSKTHAKEWLIFPENIGKRLSIDETSLSNGELYTILTNKAKGKKAIVAMVAGTKQKAIVALKNPSQNIRMKFSESPLIWQEIWMFSRMFSKCNSRYRQIPRSKTSFRSSAKEIRIKYRRNYRSMKLMKN
jgi:translation initiation factor RLI1